MDTNHSKSHFDEVNERVETAANYLNLKRGQIRALQSCEREVVISIPLRDDDDVNVLQGYRVQHSSARGPRKKRRWPISEDRCARKCLRFGYPSA